MPKVTKNISYLSFDVFTDSDSSRFNAYIENVNNHLPKEIRIPHSSTSKSDEELDLPVVCYPDRDRILDHISLVMGKINRAKKSNEILKTGLSLSTKVCVRSNNECKSFLLSLAASVLGHKTIRNLCENLSKFVGLNLSTDAKKALAAFEFDDFMNSLEKSNWSGTHQRMVKKAFGLFIYEDQLFFVDPAYKSNPSFLQDHLPDLPSEILDNLLAKSQTRSDAKQKLSENMQGPSNPRSRAASEQVTAVSQEHMPPTSFSFDNLKHDDGKFYYDTNCMIALTIQDVQKKMRILREFASFSTEDYKKLFEKKKATGSLYHYDIYFSGYQCQININVLMRLIVCKQRIDDLHSDFFEKLTVHHPYIFKEYADWVAKRTPMLVCVDSSIYYEEVRATFRDKFLNTFSFLTLPDIMKNDKYHLFTVDADGKRTVGEYYKQFELNDVDFNINSDEFLGLDLDPPSDEAKESSEDASVSLQSKKASDSQAKEVQIATEEDVEQWKLKNGEYNAMRLENQFQIFAVLKTLDATVHTDDAYAFKTFTSQYGEPILNYFLKKYNITLDLSKSVLPDCVQGSVSKVSKRSKKPPPDQSHRCLRSSVSIFDQSDPFFQCVLDQEHLKKVSHGEFCELSEKELSKMEFEVVRQKLTTILQSFPTDNASHSSERVLKDSDSEVISDLGVAPETSLLPKDSSGEKLQDRQDAIDMHDADDPRPADQECGDEQATEQENQSGKRVKIADTSSGTLGTAVVVSDKISESFFRVFDAFREQAHNLMGEKDRIIRDLQLQLNDQAQLDAMRAQIQQLQTEKTQLKQEHDIEIENLKKTHAREIEELKKTHAGEIEELKSKHSLEHTQLAEISDITAKLARLKEEKEVLFYKKEVYDNWQMQQNLNYEIGKQQAVEDAKAQVATEKDQVIAKLTEECQNLKETNKRLNELLTMSGRALASYSEDLKRRQPAGVPYTPRINAWLQHGAASGSSSASEIGSLKPRDTDGAASGSGGNKTHTNGGGSGSS